MAEKQDVLKITIQFNKKKILLQEVGENALPTYQKMLDVFKNPVESSETEENKEKTEITDYA